MFVFENLSFRYRDYIFEEYNDALSERRIGITGCNGSGKTTLLRLIDGQLKPQKGSIKVPGESYLVDFNLENYRRFTANDIVALYKPLASFDVSEFEILADKLRFTAYLGIPIGELSKGSAKKISLILGFMSVYPVLLLDEPFESIDRESNQEIIKLLRERTQEIVVVSHDLEKLKESVDAIYEIQERRLVKL